MIQQSRQLSHDSSYSVGDIPGPTTALARFSHFAVTGDGSPRDRSRDEARAWPRGAGATGACPVGRRVTGRGAKPDIDEA